MTGMISSIMLVTNSSVSEVKGIVNGIGIALLSLGGGGGYALAAVVFAWSQNNGTL